MMLPAAAARFWARDIAAHARRRRRAAPALAGVCRPAGLLSTPSAAVRAGDHPRRRRALSRCRSSFGPRRRPGLAASAAAGISKRDRQHHVLRDGRHAIADLASPLAALLALLARVARHGAGQAQVVASFSILGDLVRKVGGDRVEVTTLVGPNGDAHVYPAVARRRQGGRRGAGRRRQRPRLRRLDDRALGQGVRQQGAAASRPAQGITPRDRWPRTRTSGHGGTDPHAWQSVANAKIYRRQHPRRR